MSGEGASSVGPRAHWLSLGRLTGVWMASVWLALASALAGALGSTVLSSTWSAGLGSVAAIFTLMSFPVVWLVLDRLFATLVIGLRPRTSHRPFRALMRRQTLDALTSIGYRIAASVAVAVWFSALLVVNRWLNDDGSALEADSPLDLVRTLPWLGSTAALIYIGWRFWPSIVTMLIAAAACVSGAVAIEDLGKVGQTWFNRAQPADRYVEYVFARPIEMPRRAALEPMSALVRVSPGATGFVVVCEQRRNPVGLTASVAGSVSVGTTLDFGTDGVYAVESVVIMRGDPDSEETAGQLRHYCDAVAQQD